jgi:hypothetical protein
MLSILKEAASSTRLRNIDFARYPEKSIVYRNQRNLPDKAAVVYFLLQLFLRQVSPFVALPWICSTRLTLNGI